MQPCLLMNRLRLRESLGLTTLVACALLASGLQAQWLNPPRLHNPTWSTVTVAGVAEFDMQVRLGKDATRVDIVRAGQLWSRVVPAPRDVTIQTRPVHSSQRWITGPTLQLRPLPQPDAASVRVAIASDTHAWVHVSHSHPIFPSTALGIMKAAMDNIVASQADLLVHNGDFGMTWCGGGCQASLPSASTGTIDDLPDALQRMRSVWSVDVLGRAGSIPSLCVMGDHEGLMPWTSVPGTPTENLGLWSAEALSRTLPTPRSAPDGSFVVGPPGSSSWALRSGELLLIGLDVHSNMLSKPTAPEHWQLAPEHLAWFESVLALPITHKVVIAEHMLGGLSSADNGHWKGRSSLKATDDGTVTGTFTGGQAALHALLVKHGADLFLTGHDHVAAFGMKDGVAYLTGGRASTIGGGWITSSWYRDAMDYDGDGVPEYETGVTGTRFPGHFELEAVSGGELRIRYIRAAAGDANGTELLSFTLDP